MTRVSLRRHPDLDARCEASRPREDVPLPDMTSLWATCVGGRWRASLCIPGRETIDGSGADLAGCVEDVVRAWREGR